MMAKPCSQQTLRQIQPSRPGSKLSFSSKQLETFRQIAKETRQSMFSSESKMLAFSSSGVLALFSGSSGTGKTMAAGAIARELGTSLYRVNLQQVVSKYIGETEKNLVRIFAVAQQKGAVLFFDEADALLGKRSEVKDSHHRYANVAINYLLAKVEAYRGLVILASSHKVDIDPKVMCRVKYLLEFSPPISSPPHFQPRS